MTNNYSLLFVQRFFKSILFFACEELARIVIRETGVFAELNDFTINFLVIPILSFIIRWAIVCIIENCDDI